MIEVKDLSLRLGDFHLKDINLSIRDGEYFVILGPTGAGKTVIMECVAGLHHVKKGGVYFNGADATHMVPEERNLGYVPQDYVLFPFLNVFNNIAFGLKQLKIPRSEIPQRVNELAEIVDISHLLNRDTHALSGGEKQRIALARALATSPRILLLDEPMGALDQRTARYLRLELRRVHQQLGLTTIHITHDLIEALEMADRVAVIQDGQVQQVTEPEKMLFFPAGEKVAEFIGSPNILDCDYCRDLGQGIMEIGCGNLKLTVAHEGSDIKKVAILPRHIYVSETRPPGLSVNGFQGFITSMESTGNTVKIWIDVAGQGLMSEIPSYIFEEMDLDVGKEVFLILRMRRIRVYESSQ
jgi:ABC-type sugar transport system ATPase subunit